MISSSAMLTFDILAGVSNMERRGYWQRRCRNLLVLRQKAQTPHEFGLVLIVGSRTRHRKDCHSTDKNMYRIDAFPTNAILNCSGIPLTDTRPAEEQVECWQHFCDDLIARPRFMKDLEIDPKKATLKDGASPAQQYRVVDQFECDGVYLLLIDSLSLQSSKQRFGGYWVREHSGLVIALISKDYADIEWHDFSAYNWRWQISYPYRTDSTNITDKTDTPLTNIQIGGLSDVQIKNERELTFRWQTRGLMRLRLLREAKFGYTYFDPSMSAVIVVAHLDKSRLRLRRKYELTLPNSRTFWSLWRRLYEIFMIG